MKPVGIPVVSAEKTAQILPRIDVVGTLRQAFIGLARGAVVQPAQNVVLLPDNQGDFINYLAVDMTSKVLGAKISPYLVTAGRPIITAWTLLMSTETGMPLMLCDASLLTIERTAATTALAIDYLAPQTAKKLTLIGTGPVGLAHLRQVVNLRQWEAIGIYSRKSSLEADALAADLALPAGRISVHTSLDEAVQDTDVLMLCTSSATPVIDPSQLTRPCLITSIGTNAPGAHEVPPESLAGMEVYCDYRQITPLQAGEMVLAASATGWNHNDIKGDLVELCSGACEKPTFRQHVFFRSVGLGLEDVAIACQLMNNLQAQDK